MNKKTLQKYHKEVSARLNSLDAIKPGNHYNSPTPTLGLSVPQSRQALKEGYSFLFLNPDDVIEVLDYIWRNARFFEEMSQSIYFYEKKSLTQKQFKIITGWIDRCDNWAHSDGLSSIYARALEENPDVVLPVLSDWNFDINPWKRRQSVVSLLYYARLRKKRLSFDRLIKPVTNLLADKEYYVQKGIGWTLREIYNCYPEPTLAFLKKNIKKISADAWQASTEKLTPDQKNQLISLRYKK